VELLENSQNTGYMISKAVIDYKDVVIASEVPKVNKRHLDKADEKKQVLSPC